MLFSTRGVGGWNCGWGGVGRWLLMLGCLAVGCGRVLAVVLRGVDGERVWVEHGGGGGFYGVGGASECGADGGRGDAADHGDDDCGEWI